MTSPQTGANIRKTLLISTDQELLNMARGAFDASGEIRIAMLQKPVTEVATEIREAHYDALVIDIDATSVADFEQLQKIKRMAGASTAIIVVSENFSPSAARILIQLKVTDFLVKPMATSDFVRSINNALKMSSENAQVEPQFLAFMPASGGVGNTVLALEAAAILNRYGKQLGRTTCVVDLNFQHGSCAEYLDLEPRFDINEVENQPERLDRQLLDVMLSKHSSGLCVLAAPTAPAEMRSFNTDVVVRMLDLVSAYFDNVVIDMPRTWFPWTETVLLGSNNLYIVSELTVPCLRHTQRLIKAIYETAGKEVKPQVIVNRFEQRMFENGIKQADVEEILGEHFAGGISNNYRLVREAVDRGVPLQEIDPEANVIMDLKRIILPEESVVMEKKPRSIFSLGKGFLRKAG